MAVKQSKLTFLNSKFKKKRNRLEW
jgi:hypothetical protein